MANNRFNKQSTPKGYKAGGRTGKMGGGMMMKRPMMKKGGRVKKKKQGYKDRKDESIPMIIKKKRTKKQLKASRDDSYGKFGSKAKKSGKINR